MLARRLLRTVRVSQGHEELLWKELVSRLEKSQKALTPKKAAQVMNLSSMGEDAANQVASRLRVKIREASRSLIPDPGVYLSKNTYAILVTKDPPAGWKQNLGPSIGFLLADAGDWFIGHLLQGTLEITAEHKHDLIIEVSNDDPVTEALKLERLLERTHGVLIVPVSNIALDAKSKELLANHDCVLVDRYLHDLPEIPSVHPDDISAGRQAALYLRERGCRRVLVVDQGSRLSDTFSITPLQDRVRGAQIELAGSIPVRRLRAAGYDEQGGFDALEEFERKEPLTETDGIFALTDRLALGCRHYLLRRQPPLELPIIGTEGQAFGDFLTPPLVSVGFDAVEMGRQAARVLFARLQERDFPESACTPHFLIPPTLIIPSSEHWKRQRIPVNFPDAAKHYASTKSRSSSA